MSAELAAAIAAVTLALLRELLLVLETRRRRRGELRTRGDERQRTDK